MYGRFAGLAVAARILREAEIGDCALAAELHGMAARLEAMLAQCGPEPYGRYAASEPVLEWVDD